MDGTFFSSRTKLVEKKTRITGRRSRVCVAVGSVGGCFGTSPECQALALCACVCSLFRMDC